MQPIQSIVRQLRSGGIQLRLLYFLTKRSNNRHITCKSIWHVIIGPIIKKNPQYIQGA